MLLPNLVFELTFYRFNRSSETEIHERTLLLIDILSNEIRNIFTRRTIHPHNQLNNFSLTRILQMECCFHIEEKTISSDKNRILEPLTQCRCENEDQIN